MINVLLAFLISYLGHSFILWEFVSISYLAELTPTDRVHIIMLHTPINALLVLIINNIRDNK